MVYCEAVYRHSRLLDDRGSIEFGDDFEKVLWQKMSLPVGQLAIMVQLPTWWGVAKR
jgi:hypothetical protein